MSAVRGEGKQNSVEIAAYLRIGSWNVRGERARARLVQLFMGEMFLELLAIQETLFTSIHQVLTNLNFEAVMRETNAAD